jgi:hypothetical protein
MDFEEGADDVSITNNLSCISTVPFREAGD